MNVAIEARSLSKTYGEKTAVNNVHFQIKKGECYGFIGPNGSGKSTIARMIYCATSVTSGELYVQGLDVKTNALKIKAQLGVVPQENGLDFDLSVLDNLLIFADYHGIEPRKALTKARDLLRLMHLEDYEEKSCFDLSEGMQRKVAIGRALIVNPSILIFDEPSTGLDSQSRQWIWTTISNLKREGVTVFLTTHYMDEAEKLCDRIALIDNGRILEEGVPKDLISEQVGREVVEFFVDTKEMDYYLEKVRDRYEYKVLNNRMRLFVKNGQQSQDTLRLVASSNIVIRKATLEDVFLKVAGHEVRAER